MLTKAPGAWDVYSPKTVSGPHSDHLRKFLRLPLLPPRARPPQPLRAPSFTPPRGTGGCVSGNRAPLPAHCHGLARGAGPPGAWPAARAAPRGQAEGEHRLPRGKGAFRGLCYGLFTF